MRFFLCCTALCFSAAVNAQAVSDEMRKDITELLETTGALKIGDQMSNVISQQIINAMKSQDPNVPAAATDLVVQVVRENINAAMSSDESIAGLVEIYANHYTADDIKTLLAFFSAPVGQKMIQEGPQISL